MSHATPEPGSSKQPESQEPYETQSTTVLQATGQEPDSQDWGQPQRPKPFVPKKRFKMGRLTQILLAVLLVAVGFFAGAGVTKAIDAGQTRPGRGQFQNSGGGQGRNRPSGAPTNGAPTNEASPSAVPSAPTTKAP